MNRSLFCRMGAGPLMTVLDGIAHQRNIWLVLLSALLCAAGSWVTMRLLGRSASLDQIAPTGQLLGAVVLDRGKAVPLERAASNGRAAR